MLNNFNPLGTYKIFPSYAQSLNIFGLFQKISKKKKNILEARVNDFFLGLNICTSSA